MTAKNSKGSVNIKEIEIDMKSCILARHDSDFVTTLSIISYSPLLGNAKNIGGPYEPSSLARSGQATGMPTLLKIIKDYIILINSSCIIFN